MGKYCVTENVVNLKKNYRKLKGWHKKTGNGLLCLTLWDLWKMWDHIQKCCSHLIAYAFYTGSLQLKIYILTADMRRPYADNKDFFAWTTCPGKSFACLSGIRVIIIPLKRDWLFLPPQVAEAKYLRPSASVERSGRLIKTNSLWINIHPFRVLCRPLNAKSTFEPRTGNLMRIQLHRSRQSRHFIHDATLVWS